MFEQATIYDKKAQSYLRSQYIYDFDSIRFPGGTIINAKKFSCGIVYREREITVEFLVTPYIKIDKKSKSIGGTLSTHLDILRLKLEQKTGLIINPNKAKEIKSLTTTTEDEIEKRFFLVNSIDCKGSLLECKVNPFNPETGKPMWITVEMMSHILSMSHRIVAAEGIEALGNTSFSLYKKLSGMFKVS